MEHPVQEFSRVFFAIELIGLVAFAVSGALIAIEREMDIFGVLVLALITALGGGVIRDIIADRFPVSLRIPIYFYTALAGTLFAVPFRRATPKSLYWLKVFDALGLAMFSVLGARVGIAQDNFLSTVLLGVLTGIGGGMLRDIIANEIPLVLRQEVSNDDQEFTRGEVPTRFTHTGDLVGEELVMSNQRSKTRLERQLLEAFLLHSISRLNDPGFLLCGCQIRTKKILRQFTNDFTEHIFEIADTLLEDPDSLIKTFENQVFDRSGY
jgi:uncharacterized membrane protein YeiH